MGPRIKAAVRRSHRPVVMVTEADFATACSHPHRSVRWRDRCRKAVTQVKYGADHIKYAATGELTSLTAGTEQQFTDEGNRWYRLPTPWVKWQLMRTVKPA